MKKLIGKLSFIKKLKGLKYLNVAAVVILILIFTFKTDKRNFGIEPISVSTIKSADIYSFHSIDKTNDVDWASEKIGVVRPGVKVKIMEEFFEWYKIMLPDGTMGWVEAPALAPTTKCLMHVPDNFPYKLLERPDSESKVLKELFTTAWVTRIDKLDKKANGVDVSFTKIKTEDGSVGWVRSSQLEHISAETKRFVDRQRWEFTRSPFVNEWQGKTIDSFVEKFSEPFAITLAGNTKTYFYSNIMLFQGPVEELGLKVTSTNGTITDFSSTVQTEKMIGNFPLADEFRIPAFVNNFGYVLDKDNWRTYNEYGKTDTDIKIKLPKALSWALGILVFVIFVYFLFSIVTFSNFLSRIAVKYIIRIGKIPNSLMLSLIALAVSIINYIMFVFLSVNFYPLNNYFIFYVILAIGMPLGFTNEWRWEILYNRCRKCRLWTGVPAGTSGTTKTTETTTTTYSDGSKTVDKKDHLSWTDYQECTNCGYTWAINRRT